MDYFGLPARLLECEERLEATAGPDRVPLLAELAWYLRERDTARALSFVREAQALLAVDVGSEAASPAQDMLQARLTLTLAEERLLNGAVDEAQQLALGAVQRFEHAGDGIGAGDARMLEARILRARGATSLFTAALEAAASQYDAASEKDQIRSLFCQLSRGIAAIWSDPSADDAWRAVVDRCLVHEHLGLVAFAESYVALLDTARGDYANSIVSGARAWELGLVIGQLRLAYMEASNVASMYGELNSKALSWQWAERAIEIARRTRWPQLLGLTSMRLGEQSHRLGRPEQALELLLEAEQVLLQLPRSRAQAMVHRLLGRVELDLALYDQALLHFESVASTARAIAHPDLLLDAAMGQGQALCRLGRWQDARVCAELAREIAQQVKDRHADYNLHRLFAEIAYAQAGVAAGDAAARALLERALEIAENLSNFEVPDDLLQALAREYEAEGDLARALAFERRAAEARAKAYSQKTAEIAVDMQVRHDTERARAEADHHRTLGATLAQTNDTLQRLGDIGREITRHLDERAIFDVLQRGLDALLEGRRLAVFLLDDVDAAQEAPPVAALSLAFGVVDGESVDASLRITLDDPVSAVARCAREHLEIVGDTVPDSTTPGTLAVPLEATGRLLGVMTLQGAQSQVPGERERLIFRTLCAYTAIGLNNARMYRQQLATAQALQAARDVLARTNSELERAWQHEQEASLTDPLTGLRNRRFLNERMEEDVALALRRAEASTSGGGGQALVFFMIDLDHFKSVNDQHGHAAGDQVLVQMAQRMRVVVRGSDYLVRWGGEEFLVVARDITPQQGAALAARLCQAAASQPFDIGGGASLVRTCSVGFAAYPFQLDARRMADWYAMVELADHALYRAKHGGRDRWVGLCAVSASPSREHFERLSREPDAALADGAVTLMQTGD